MKFLRFPYCPFSRCQLRFFRNFKVRYTKLYITHMRTKRNYRYSVSLRYFKFRAIGVTITPPGVFSVLHNLRTKSHTWKSHGELAVKQLSGCHCQRNVAIKFSRINRIATSGKCIEVYHSITCTVQNRWCRRTKGNTANDIIGYYF